MRVFFKRWAIRWGLVCVGVAVAPAPAYGMEQNISPFQIRNYHPLVQIYGMPYIGAARTLGKGESRVNLIYALSSNYAVEKNSNEAFLIDGESTNVTLSYTAGVGKSLQLALYLPYVKHDPGSLDGFINSWHDTFNLRQGGRDLAPTDRLRYYYQKDGNVRMDFVTNTEGLGDISLNAQLALGESMNQKHDVSALAINLKLPTGNSETLLGSGAFDLAVWYKREKKTRFFNVPSGIYYSTGLLFLGKGEVFSDMQKSTVFLAGGGLGLNFGKYWGLKAQLDYYSPFYDKTEFNSLGGHSLQLVLGGSIYFTKTLKLDLGLAEDLIIDASPDVVFHVDFSAEF